MNETDRRKIISNMDELSNKLPYDLLKQEFRKKGVFSDTMIREIEKHSGENEERKMRRLLTKLTKRGPQAFTALLEILIQNRINDAVKIMEPSYVNLGDDQSCTHQRMLLPEQLRHLQPPETTRASNSLSPREPLSLRPFVGEVFPDPQLPNFIMSNKFHISDKLSTYHMRSKNRGVLFFVNIINFKNKEHHRNGAHMDRNNLIWVFRKMGFVVFYYEDLLASELEMLLNELIVSDYLRRADCLVFSLMTHGARTGVQELVQFTDDGYMDIERIMSKFYNSNCPIMVRRPKVLILPYCRGEKPDPGLAITVRKHTEQDGMMKISTDRNSPTISDILVCYGTVPGFSSNRDIEQGSWFVQELCRVLASHSHDTDLETMLKIIMGRLIDWRTDDMCLQTSSYESFGFACALFFNPGYYA